MITKIQLDLQGRLLQKIIERLEKQSEFIERLIAIQEQQATQSEILIHLLDKRFNNP